MDDNTFIWLMIVAIPVIIIILATICMICIGTICGGCYLLCTETSFTQGLISCGSYNVVGESEDEEV